MTVLALRSAARRNGVSQLHGFVSRQMWAAWASRRRRTAGAGDGPPSPTAAHRHLGRPGDGRPVRPRPAGGLARRTDDPANWRGLCTRPRALGRRAPPSERACWSAWTPWLAPKGWPAAEGVTAERALVLVSPAVRHLQAAGLLLADPERLMALLGGAGTTRPVVIVFAGRPTRAMTRAS